MSANHPDPKHAPVLLAGATGFIGRRVQHALLEAGRNVRALVRPASSNCSHVDSRCELVESGLTEVPALARAVRGCSAVVYCAGSVRGRSLADFLPANAEGVRNLLRALAGADVATPFLLISSLAAGRPELSQYARSKHLGEEMVRDHAPGPWTVLRPPAVYGPGDREMRPILAMARRGLIFRPGPADQRVSLLYVDDLAGAVLAWLGAPEHTNGAIFTLDDGRPGGYDWPAIAVAAGRVRARILPMPSALLAAAGYGNLLLSRLFGYAPMLTPGKARELTQSEWLCDNSGFSAATGWRPQTGLASGLRLTLGERIRVSRP